MAKKPVHAKPETTDQPSKTPPQFRILKKSQCLTVSGKSDLTYHTEVDPNGAISVRVTSASGGGFFSIEWVPLKVILNALDTRGPITSNFTAAPAQGSVREHRSLLPDGPNGQEAYPLGNDQSAKQQSHCLVE